jgi:hypothetical protein
MTNNDEMAIKPVGNLFISDKCEVVFSPSKRPIAGFQFAGSVYSAEQVNALLAERDADKKRIAELELEKETMTAAELAMRDDMRHARSLLKSGKLSQAAVDLLSERRRQVTVEGWTPEHDDQHRNNDLAFAASCYAFHAGAASWDMEDDGMPYDSHPAPKIWPWEPEWWKPKSPRSDLVRAAALILAEIERLDRAAGIKLEVGE